MIKALVLDMDGTLVYTLEDYLDAVNYAMDKRGYPLQDDLELFKSYFGNTAKGLILRCLPEGTKNDETLSETLADMADFYNERCTVGSPPYEGIPELLTELSALGIERAIISDKEDELVRRIATLRFPCINFGFIAGLSDSILSKPHPGRIMTYLNKFSLRPNECAMLGDEYKDMQMAKACGIRAIGAAWGYHSADVLVQYGADVIADTPDAVLGLLK